MNVLDKFKLTLSVLVNYAYDASRYCRYSSTMGIRSRRQLEAKIIAGYHMIEKAFSLPNVRPGFGKDNVDNLIRLLNRFDQEKYCEGNLHYEAAIHILHDYFIFQKEHDQDVLELEKRFFALKGTPVRHEGVLTLTRKEIQNGGGIDFGAFANSRYSIRNFSEEPVEEGLVEQAIELARKTPSVCNRQSWRIYQVKSPRAKCAVGELQNGNRGFGDVVDTFLVVTSDLQTFHGINERNQAYIDGGLFSMSVMYALHSLGIGSCPLNWCVNHKRNRLMHAALEIPDTEVCIMIIAVGNLPEKVNVAASARRNLDELIVRK